MANSKDKEPSTNPEVKRTDDFQDGVDIKESVIELAKELLESTTEDAFSKMGYEKTEKKAGFYGTGKSYGAGVEQNKFGIRIAGKTKSSLEKQVMLGVKRVQSDIDFNYNGKMVNVEYKTTEAGFFRGVENNKYAGKTATPYTFTKTITFDASKKAEMQKAMKELFAEAAKKEVGYLSNTKLGVEDKTDKGTTSTVNENKKSMKKLTLKSIFSPNENLFGAVNESKKENIQPIKDNNAKPLSSVSPYNKGEKKAEKGKSLFFDNDDKELNERATDSSMGKDEYLNFVKGEMKKKFGTSEFKALTPVEKKELFKHIDRTHTSKAEKEKSFELNEDGAGATMSGPSGAGAGAFLTPNAFKKTVKETSYGKEGKNKKRPKVTDGYKVVPMNENDNFWTTVSQKSLDNLKHNHIIGAPGMEGIKVNSPEELEFASKGLNKHGIKNESIESPKAKLDLTKKKMFSTSENEAKGINKRYLVTEKTSDEYLKERWKKLTNFKINESINENAELNEFLNDCSDKPEVTVPAKSYKAPVNESKEVIKSTNNTSEETVTVKKPGSLFEVEYMFYKKDFLNENKKYILDLNSKVFVPNPNVK